MRNFLFLTFLLLLLFSILILFLFFFLLLLILRKISSYYRLIFLFLSCFRRGREKVEHDAQIFHLLIQIHIFLVVIALNRKKRLTAKQLSSSSFFLFRQEISIFANENYFFVASAQNDILFYLCVCVCVLLFYCKHF